MQTEETLVQQGFPEQNAMEPTKCEARRVIKYSGIVTGTGAGKD